MSSKKVLGAMDCGCLILEREQIADLSPTYYSVEYCSKHKAAPRLLEELHRSQFILSRISDKRYNEEIIEQLDKNRKALAKAEGK